MLSQLWSALLDYLKGTPYWSRVEPVLLAIFMYVGAVVCAFQYVQWRYGVTLELPLFLHSYLFRQTSVAFLAIVASLIVLTYRSRRATTGPGAPAARRTIQLAARLTAVFLIGATAFFALQWLAPHARVSSIRVMFAARDALSVDAEAVRGPSSEAVALRSDALTYLVFNLNRLQRSWHFEIDPSPLAWDRISAPAEERCRRDPAPSLCFTKAYYLQEHARDPTFPPIVVIMADTLGMRNDQYYFWLHDGTASVITTRDWEGIRAPTLYEYLAYTLVLQGVLTHLDAQCGGVPARDPEKSGIIYGNVFEYYPQRDAFKAAILAGHLGPDDERLLLNCFGADYLDTTTRLLGLAWLHTEPVRSNLRSVYGIEIIGVGANEP
jgi:hypothetical protein